MRDRPLLSVLVVTLVVVGAAGLVAIAAPVGAQTAGDPGANGSAADGSGANATADGSVSVTAGAQLSTVLSVTSDDVHAEVEETAFEVEYERGEGRAEAVADRAETVRMRAADVRENYREALKAYREGDLDRSEFARRLAALNARAGNVLGAHDRLERRAANVSAFDLRAAGLNRTALERAVASLDDVRGTGAGALLAQFTGERRGEVELEASGGLSIEVSSEGGERSREFEREPDGDTAVTVNQSVTLETARAALTDVENGSWVLTDASIDSGDGTYEFEFVLRAGGLTGEAEVGVDGSSGEVFSLEEETEPDDDEEGKPGGDGEGKPGDDREERESDEDDEGGEDEGDDGHEDREFEELSLLVAGGQPGPDETVTVRVLTDGRAVANASVAVNGEAVGETGDDGTLALTLPAAGDVTVTAVAGGEEATLDVGLGDDLEFEAEFERNFAFPATLEDGTVSVRAAYGGDGIPDATVYADGEAVGRTDADGSLHFDVGDVGDDLKLDLVKGAFEAEYEFAAENGSLTLTDREYDRDGHRDEHRQERDDGDDNDGNDRDGNDDGTDAGSDDEEDDSDSDDGDEEDDSDDGDEEDDSDDGEDGDDSNDDEDDGDDDDGNGDDENDDSES